MQNGLLMSNIYLILKNFSQETLLGTTSIKCIKQVSVMHILKTNVIAWKGICSVSELSVMQYGPKS